MPSTDTGSADVILNALADIQRRQLLFALLEHNPQQISPPSTNTDERYGTMYHHVHFPKLADAGFITYESEGTKKVKKGPRFGEVQPILEFLADHSDEFHEDQI